MNGFWGADTEALRAQAAALRNGATRLGELQTTLRSQVAAVEWTGADAEAFRADFSSRVDGLFTTVIDGTGVRAGELEGHAEEQDRASDGSEGGGILDGLKDLLANPAVIATTAGVSTVLAGIKGFKAIQQIRDLRALQQALRDGRMRAPIRIADRMGSRALGMLGRVGGRVFGPLGVVTGIMDIVNPPHDGWRGIGDRVAGGLGVVGGVGLTALALGATLNPVGLAGVGVAAAGAALWTAGNAIWDNREAIGDFFSDMGGHVSDAVDTVKDFVGDIGEGIGDFVGGLF